jgi:hypothetical protein
MSRYRKKPVVVEAFQLPALDEDADAFSEWAARVEFDGYTSEREGCMAIETLEGTMTAEPGDWIVKGVAGEFYPVKPHIFEHTYESAEAERDRYSWTITGMKHDPEGSWTLSGKE